jgi:phosphohistidine phosphatase
MALFLVQHGKSLPKEKDPEQGLSEQGIADVERIAGMAREYGVHVSLIRHSGKKRAKQTADIFAASLNPEKGVQERIGLKPLDDVAAVVHEVSGKENLMLVGHLPFMERLTSYLITGSTDRPVFRFQNGGILCLNQDPETHAWVIKWSLMPKIE